MNELFSTIVKWFGDNGTASDWFTSFGTVGAVVTSLYLAKTQNKVKLKAELISNVTGDLHLVIKNKSKYIANIHDIGIIEFEEFMKINKSELVESSQYNYNLAIDANSVQKIEIYSALMNKLVIEHSGGATPRRVKVYFIIKSNNQMFKSECYELEIYIKNTSSGTELAIKKSM